ncbi:MAG: EscU/YscU/HrcU family type III secretion system export apparatus switch protein, partial [Leptospiraceae bacterium]|nr:EscU/YscU/HrcU family type III secretion system export apparatus switch protein [Leptospiraceae bacterium]
MAENSDSLLDSTSPEYFVELNPVDGSVGSEEALHARPQEEILEDCGFRAIDLLARTGATSCSADPFSPGFQGALDLQLFAAEDEGRTEEPSERRKREEREKGNVPKSQDLAGSAILIGGVLILFFFGTYIVQRIGELFARYFGLIATQGGVFGIEELQVLMKDLFLQTGMILAPILIVTILMGVLGNVVQVGLMFSLQTLEFKLERLIPDFKRVLPVRRNIFNLLKVIAQMLIIAGAAYLVVVDDFIPMLKSGGMGLTQAVVVFATVAFKLLLLCGVLLLILSIPDYFYQRFEYIENLKITTAEAKRERKD